MTLIDVYLISAVAQIATAFFTGFTAIFLLVRAFQRRKPVQPMIFMESPSIEEIDAYIAKLRESAATPQTAETDEHELSEPTEDRATDC